MSSENTAVGERLPYLLAKMKAPRVLERLEATAARAREERWPYEQLLETLLEAEVFARDASGARQRIRHAAFPAHKTLEDFDFTAQPGGRKRSGRLAGQTRRPKCGAGERGGGGEASNVEPSLPGTAKWSLT
jgi:DNA replication protein DnaC